MSQRHLRSWVLPALLTASAGCGQLLGLGDFTNECGGALDAECAPGTGGAPPGTCNPGEKKPCYTGDDPLTEGVGICHSGMKTCGLNGLFGACEGEVLPKAHEDCDNELDDDCNGMVNDQCPCTQGEMHACYSGDPATQDVGLCKGGMQACNPAGDGFGACMGDVVPAMEDDYTHKGDENCDGIPSADTLWLQTFDYTSDTAGLSFTGVAADAAGDLYVVGTFVGDVTFGSSTLSAPPPQDGAFVGKLSADGVPLWAKVYDSNITNPTSIPHIAFDSDNSQIVVAGTVDVGPASFGAGALPVGSFVVALDPDGQQVWSVACTPFTVNGVGVGSGLVTIAGWQTATTTFTCDGDSADIDPNAKESIVLAQVNGGDVFRINTLSGPNAYARLEGLAVSPGGAAFFAGSLQGTATAWEDGTQVTGMGTGSVLIGKFATQGGSLLRAFGDGSSYRDPITGPDQTARAVAVDAAANAYVVGSTAGVVSFGSTALDSSGADQMFLVSLDAALEPRWATGFSNTPGGGHPTAVQVLSNGDTVFAGQTSGTTDFGTGPESHLHHDYTFLAKQAATGAMTPPTPVWGRYYGSDTATVLVPLALAVAPGSAVAPQELILTGGFVGPVDFGTGVETPSGPFGSTFLMRVAP